MRLLYQDEKRTEYEDQILTQKLHTMHRQWQLLENENQSRNLQSLPPLDERQAEVDYFAVLP